MFRHSSSASASEHEVMPVPDHATHKVSPAERLLPSFRRYGERVVFDARVPRDHPYYSEAGFGSALLQAELLRQSTIAFTHLVHSVPEGWAFVMRRMRLERYRHLEDAELAVSVTATAVDARPRHIRALSSEVLFEQNGRLVGRGWGELRVTNPGVYARLRGNAALPSPALRHAAHAKGISLSHVQGGSNEWRLEYDVSNDFYFDHPMDHVPGMLLFSAACMAAASRGGGEVAAFDGRFSRYVEFTESLRLSLGDQRRVGALQLIDLSLSGANSAPVCETQIRVSSDGLMPHARAE